MVASYSLSIWLSGRYFVTWYLNVVYFFIFLSFSGSVWVVYLFSSNTLFSRLLNFSLTLFIHIHNLVFSTFKALIHFIFLTLFARKIVAIRRPA